jgi:hypothetical protein
MLLGIMVFVTVVVLMLVFRKAVMHGISAVTGDASWKPAKHDVLNRWFWERAGGHFYDAQLKDKVPGGDDRCMASSGTGKLFAAKCDETDAKQRFSWYGTTLLNGSKCIDDTLETRECSDDTSKWTRKEGHLVNESSTKCARVDVGGTLSMSECVDGTKWSVDM